MFLFEFHKWKKKGLFAVLGIATIACIYFLISNSGDKYIIENAKFVKVVSVNNYSSKVFGVFEEFDGTQHKLYMEKNKSRELTVGNKYNVIYVMNYSISPHDYILIEVLPTGAKRVEDK